MKLYTGLALVVLLLFAALSDALPVPQRRHDAREQPKLAGTDWVGQDGECVTTYRFEADGTLAYSYPTGSFRNGTWRVDERTLTFEINKGFYEFCGSLDGDTIVGTSWNVRGDRWSHVIRRSR
jgi:hypothetical protein